MGRFSGNKKLQPKQSKTGGDLNTPRAEDERPDISSRSLLDQKENVLELIVDLTVANILDNYPDSENIIGDFPSFDPDSFRRVIDTTSGQITNQTISTQDSNTVIYSEDFQKFSDNPQAETLYTILDSISSCYCSSELISSQSEDGETTLVCPSGYYQPDINDVIWESDPGNLFTCTGTINASGTPCQNLDESTCGFTGGDCAPEYTTLDNTETNFRLIWE